MGIILLPPTQPRVFLCGTAGQWSEWPGDDDSG